MSLVGKLSAEIHIVAPAHEFHGVWVGRPHHVANVSPETMPKVQLHDGDWGKVGAVVAWHYVLDGKNCVAKDVVEAVNEETNTVTYKVIEGDPLEEYKSIKFTVQTLPKGETNLVCWTVDYEKFKKDVPHPIKLLDIAIRLTEELDDHLVGA